MINNVFLIKYPQTYTTDYLDEEDILIDKTISIYYLMMSYYYNSNTFNHSRLHEYYFYYYNL